MVKNLPSHAGNVHLIPGLRTKSPHVWMCSITQWCLTLCDPMDYSPTGFSVHGIFQSRMPEWVAISFPRGSSRPRDQTWVSCIFWIGRQVLNYCTTWEAKIPHADGQLSWYTATAAAAAAKPLQSCPTLCNPIDGSPPHCSWRETKNVCVTKRRPSTAKS